MKAWTAVLLALLLLFGEPGRGQAQNEEDEDEDDEDFGVDSYEDDYDEEINLFPVEEDKGQLRCYYCRGLQEGEVCNQMQDCFPDQAFCETLIARDSIESSLQSTYTAWCADDCEPVTRTMEGTWVTVTCCQLPLCNAPPWLTAEDQESPGSTAGGLLDGRAGSSKGSPPTLGTALLLSLLAGLPATGS
ncbi:glycosylphosphatidylinositol-anchored high density lipoprotein-binding protein 1 [Loxodonta africana]|uniref:glycosylphosphatidylinositol-anchored high density lipoprotein-binding protein 1 n=1 Tax=Loxodonta africana TaxID=9785 RepID=UPI0030D53DA3